MIAESHLKEEQKQKIYNCYVIPKKQSPIGLIKQKTKTVTEW